MEGPGGTGAVSVVLPATINTTMRELRAALRHDPSLEAVCVLLEPWERHQQDLAGHVYDSRFGDAATVLASGYTSDGAPMRGYARRGGFSVDLNFDSISVGRGLDVRATPVETVGDLLTRVCAVGGALLPHSDPAGYFFTVDAQTAGEGSVTGVPLRTDAQLRDYPLMDGEWIGYGAIGFWRVFRFCV